MTYDQSLVDEITALSDVGRAYVLRRFGDKLNDDAEDIVQDVTLKIIQKRREDIPNVQAFFFTCLRNACIDRLRSAASKPTVSAENLPETVKHAARKQMRGNVPRPIGDDGAPSAEREATARIEKERALEVLATMTKRRQAAVIGRWCGMTVPQIAEAIGCSLLAAKKAVMRGEGQLRERLTA